jgi:HlyD family secretion protein
MKQIFPKEIIESTIEVHRFKNTVKSKIIYAILLITIICTISAIPFVYLDVYSSSRGIIKPIRERHKIISLFSGKIDSILIKQNQFVSKGDTLLVVNNDIGKERIHLTNQKLIDIQKFITDLKYISNSKKINIKSIQSFKYKKQYLSYYQKNRGLRTQYNKAKRDFVRQDKLFKKEVISMVEHENSKYNLDLAVNELNQFKKQQINQWQTELTQFKEQIKEVESNLIQLKKEGDNYIIKAPISGNIQNLIGLEKGSFLNGGAPIAEISPETNLIAECFVLPSDIGLLKENSVVKFQIDAFNFNSWGMATGYIIDINKDITIIENRPMFRVVCKLNEQHLKLKNGFKGKLKKGMTFNARFFIVRRSVFDLMYDKIDDWFVPN